MKIILYFIIISFIYNIFKNVKISFNPKFQNQKKTKNNYSNDNDHILDAEYEEI